MDTVDCGHQPREAQSTMSQTRYAHDDCRPAGRVGLAVILIAALFCGCAKMKLSDTLPWMDSELEPQVPKRVVAVWSDAVLHHAGKPSVRGFGGRLMFYAEDPQQPVKVDGQLTIYAFDDEDPDPNNPTPEKKFLFPIENFSKHHSESSLGPSYSFWLPWNEIGGFQRQLSLVSRFQDASGRVVMSKMDHVTLPGRLRAANQAAVEADPVGPAAHSDIRQATFDAPAESHSEDGEDKDKPQMQTTTIHVTPSFARKITVAKKRAVQWDRGATTEKERASQHSTILEQPSTRVAVPEAEEEADAEAEAKADDQHSRGLRLPVGFRSVRAQRQARNQPGSPPTSDPVRTQPHHAEWPRRLPPTPRYGWNRSTTTSNQPDGSAEN